jgi:peptidoglycan/xylan/chitin deacetylase (PgdA/CDA1 family)
MSWEEIRILRDNGVVIGSQTKSHPHLHKLNKSQVINELSVSNKRFVDEIGSKPSYFAYPYGEYSLEVLELVKANGFFGSIRSAFRSCSQKSWSI